MTQHIFLEPLGRHWSHGQGGLYIQPGPDVASRTYFGLEPGDLLVWGLSQYRWYELGWIFCMENNNPYIYIWERLLKPYFGKCVEEVEEQFSANKISRRWNCMELFKQTRGILQVCKQTGHLQFKLCWVHRPLRCWSWKVRSIPLTCSMVFGA